MTLEKKIFFFKCHRTKEIAWGYDSYNQFQACTAWFKQCAPFFQSPSPSPSTTFMSYSKINKSNHNIIMTYCFGLVVWLVWSTDCYSSIVCVFDCQFCTCKFEWAKMNFVDLATRFWDSATKKIKENLSRICHIAVSAATTLKSDKFWNFTYLLC